MGGAERYEASDITEVMVGIPKRNGWGSRDSQKGGLGTLGVPMDSPKKRYREPRNLYTRDSQKEDMGL